MFQCGSYVPDFFGKKVYFRKYISGEGRYFFPKKWMGFGVWGAGDRVAVGPLNFLGKKKRNGFFCQKKCFSVEVIIVFQKKWISFKNYTLTTPISHRRQ